MGEVKPRVELMRYTTNPEELTALAAKLCYSPADLHELQKGILHQDQSPFLQKLTDMGHLSPLEHASFTFGVEGVSRSLLAQITRHRIASFSVQSQRYVGETDFNYIVPPRIAQLGEGAVQEFARQMKQVQGWYDYWMEQLAVHGDGAREDARFVLPNAVETKLVVTMNARQLLHFFEVRCCNRAQWEIRRLAIEMLRQVRRVAPTIFREAGPRCVAGPCTEGKMSCGEQKAVREFFNRLE